MAHNETQAKTNELLGMQVQLSTQSTSAVQRRPQHVNLPKLKLPIFSGDVLKWTEFSEMFSASVDAADLSDIQKLTYLREHLSGAAKETIAGLHLSSSNYHVAQDLLRERFGDKQIRINAHHAALMKLPCASDSTASLRGLHDTIEMHLRSLKALGENIDSAFFVSLLTGKLPRQTMVQMEMQIGGQAWTPSLFRTTLSNLIRAQESADRLTSQHSYKSTRDQPSSSTEGSESIARDPPTHTSATSPSFSTQALTTHATSGSSRTVSCAFCRGDHFSDMCTKFKTVEDRKKAAGSRCFRCLRRGHSASDCRATKKCFYCGRDTHHSSFCPKQFSDSAPPPTQAIIAAAPTNVDAVATLVGENQAVVMQTALVEVIHTDGRTHHARILFDTGSSRSFVTDSLQRRANLKVTGQDDIALATFGSPVRRTSQYSRVELQIKTNGGSVQALSANVIPEITSPIQKVSLDVKKHPSLATLPLAEPLTSSSTSDCLQIDILVGLDHYYDIIGADRMSFPDGLQLLHSTVGLVATGKVTSTSTPASCLKIVRRRTLTSTLSVSGRSNRQEYQTHPRRTRTLSHMTTSKKPSLMTQSRIVTPLDGHGETTTEKLATTFHKLSVV